MVREAESGSRALVEMRVQAIAERVQREVAPHPPVDQTSEEQHRHLLEEARQLYENELTWEEESGEEYTESGALAELVFPGTLALIDALVTTHTPNERGEGAQHRDVVVSFLDWLAWRLFKLRSGQMGKGATDRAKRVDLTDRLIDLVLYRYCGLTGGEIERLDASRS